MLQCLDKWSASCMVSLLPGRCSLTRNTRRCTIVMTSALATGCKAPAPLPCLETTAQAAVLSLNRRITLPGSALAATAVRSAQAAKLSRQVMCVLPATERRTDSGHR